MSCTEVVFSFLSLIVQLMIASGTIAAGVFAYRAWRAQGAELELARIEHRENMKILKRERLRNLPHFSTRPKDDYRRVLLGDEPIPKNRLLNDCETAEEIIGDDFPLEGDWVNLVLDNECANTSFRHWDPHIECDYTGLTPELEPFEGDSWLFRYRVIPDQLLDPRPILIRIDFETESGWQDSVVFQTTIGKAEWRRIHPAPLPVLTDGGNLID